MSARTSDPGGRKRQLKEMIRRLHDGEPPENVKEHFKKLLAEIDSEDISRVEEELINEGMLREEIRRLCDVHLLVFKESLHKGKGLAPPDHPIGILMEEHRILLEYANGLVNSLAQLRAAGGSALARGQLEHVHHVIKHFKASEKHYLREENVLFPYIEKHGVTEPPKIMWMEHDEIRRIKKELYSLAEGVGNGSLAEWAVTAEPVAKSLAEMLASHFNKENSILFPTALKIIKAEEWDDISKGFDEIGYCCFTPPRAELNLAVPKTRSEEGLADGEVEFKTGSFTLEELNAVLNALPVDISFVGKDDRLRYYSDSRDRIFVRTPAVIGRKVQQCHPQKSVHMVERILSDFKAGKSDCAEFWIDLAGKKVHIRYFPVRSPKGEYLGCLEVSQDITGIQKLKGQKRLL